MGVVEVVCHDASLRLIEPTCDISRSTALPWRREVFSAVCGR